MFGVFGLIKNIFSSSKKISYRVGMKSSSARSYVSYSPEKQEKLNKLCESLFEREELISTGKLQILGLGKIKKAMGKKWPGLQKIVYHEVEEAIAKYSMPNDIFIRYKDENYMIIFADAGAEEALIKMRLIAQDIKRRLFEHEEEAIRSLDVEESVSVIDTSKIKSKSTLLEKVAYVDKTLKTKSERPLPHVQKKNETQPSSQLPSEDNKPVVIPASFDIDPYDGNHNEKANEETIPEQDIDVLYVPIWDAQSNYLTMYLCLPNKVSNDNINYFFEEDVSQIAISHLVEQDIALLKKSLKDLKGAADSEQNLMIVCPVHYKTLRASENLEKYLFECQKFSTDERDRLIFLLYGLPENILLKNLEKISLPLKARSRHLFVIVGDHEKDLSRFRKAGADAIGLYLHHHGGGEKKILQQLEHFAQETTGNFIGKVFVLNVTSFSLTTSAVCSGINFLAGDIIHTPVQKPNNIHKFARQDLFAGLIPQDK